MAGNDQYTKSLLDFDGNITDTNAGGSAHTWTAHGGATTTAVQIKFGTASLTANAGAGWIDTPDSSDFVFGSGDFTVDIWGWKGGGDGTLRIISGQANVSGVDVSFYMGVDTSNHLTAFVSTDGSAGTTVAGTTAVPTGGWNFYTLVRTGNTLRLFLNGVQEGGDQTFTGNVNNSVSSLSIGRAGDLAGNGWIGFTDEFRLSVGIARWTTNFTPPTDAYTLDISTPSIYVEGSGVNLRQRNVVVAY